MRSDSPAARCHTRQSQGQGKGGCDVHSDGCLKGTAHGGSLKKSTKTHLLHIINYYYLSYTTVLNEVILNPPMLRLLSSKAQGRNYF